MAKKQIKIGLALGSGGARGLAHIGVIKVLEEAGVDISIISGSSIGALVGGFYAAKKDIGEIEQMALDTNRRKVVPMFFDPSLGQGLIRGNKFKQFIDSYVGEVNFIKTKIKFGAVVTDLSNAKAICLTTGDYAMAIRASISIPLLLKPVIIDEKLYVDGGLSMPVPVSFAKLLGADIVIAVNLHEHYDGILFDQKFGINTVAYKSTDILSHYLALENVRSAEVVVTPNVSGIGLFNRFMTRNGTEMVIAEGERAMRERLPELLQIIADKQDVPAPVEETKFSKFLQIMRQAPRKFLYRSS